MVRVTKPTYSPSHAIFLTRPGTLACIIHHTFLASIQWYIFPGFYFPHWTTVVTKKKSRRGRRVTFCHHTAGSFLCQQWVNESFYSWSLVASVCMWTRIAIKLPARSGKLSFTAFIQARILCTTTISSSMKTYTVIASTTKPPIGEFFEQNFAGFFITCERFYDQNVKKFLILSDDEKQ